MFSKCLSDHFAMQPLSHLTCSYNFPPVGAVSLDSAVCADMAADILRRNGSAVDSAITGMLCSGVVHAESSGIGGGGFMMVRLNNGSVYAINFRETAPKAATEDMFHSNASAAKAVSLHVPFQFLDWNPFQCKN